MGDSAVRVRFGPSLSDKFAIIYVAPVLLNWLYAKKNGGAFIYKIDDTNPSEQVEGAYEDFTSIMKWLGCIWDEGVEKGGEYGPYYQSQRFELYREYCEQLTQAGYAYNCYCSLERISALSKYQKDNKLPFGYDGCCRELSREQKKAFESEGIASTIRFKVPRDRTIIYEDRVHGVQSFDTNSIEDFIIYRSDGTPTYQLAVVVDDMLMNVTHVLRDAGNIRNTPKQILLYEAFQFRSPEFAHFPTSKFSDHEAVILSDLKKQGFCPESILSFTLENNLVPQNATGKDNLYFIDEYLKLFELSMISAKKMVKINMNRVSSLNKLYIQKYLSKERLSKYILEYLKEYWLDIVESEEDVSAFVDRNIEALRTRMKVYSDIVIFIRMYFFNPSIETYRQISDIIDIGLVSDILKRCNFFIGVSSARATIEEACMEFQIPSDLIIRASKILLTGATMDELPLDFIVRLFSKDELYRKFAVMVSK